MQVIECREERRSELPPASAWLGRWLMAGNGKYKCFSTWNSVDCHCRKMSTELGYIAMVVWCWRSQIPTIFIAWHLSEKKTHNKSTLMKRFCWSPDSWTLCWKWHPNSAILETEAGVCQLPVTALGQAEFLLREGFKKKVWKFPYFRWPPPPKVWKINFKK